MRTNRAFAPLAAVPSAVVYQRPFLVMKPERTASRGLVDEFEIWSRRFGRRLVAAMHWPLQH